MKIAKRALFILCAALLLVGCSSKSETEEEKKALKERVQKEAEEKKDRKEKESLKRQKARVAQEEQEALEKADAEGKAKKRLQTIVLDPGHSAVVAEGTEPLGPGSPEYKAADAAGTSGVSSGIPEYELTLDISIQLKAELEKRGYTVLMTRESNDVPISCMDRAEVANRAQADAYVRIHANGSEDQSAQGAMTICTTPQSSFVPEMYTSNRQLSDWIITKLCEAAGCENDSVWETDTMSGSNWSQVPATIVEMGYMTNPQEDMLMQTSEYQNKIVQGIANGIEAYLGGGDKGIQIE